MRIKICCIQSKDEIASAAGENVHSLGFVSAMPSGRGIQSISRIKDLVREVPSSQTAVLLTASRDPSVVAEQQFATGVRAIQLVSPMTPDEVRAIRQNLPGVSIIKTVHVEDETAISLALSYTRVADFILLDSGAPERETPILGGTGATHDWRISREIVQRSPLPVYLAGGLSPANVSAAIQAVRPYGVDVCSRLRPNGSLDEVLLRDFVRNAVAAA